MRSSRVGRQPGRRGRRGCEEVLPSRAEFWQHCDWTPRLPGCQLAILWAEASRRN